MGSLKSPGPDGFHPGFYKSTWDITGVAVHNFAREVLRGREVFEKAAEAILVLIPKEAQPPSIRSFRPITLCNVSLKIVTKMIVNRLKAVLKDIVAPNQASFIPGRQSIDNVIICQEVIHSLKYSKAKKGGMILKLDLEKAYDRMEWRFIEETLRDASLPTMMISTIMGLLQKSSCRLLWNGELTDQIRPTRGLRQGDPYLLTYLFSVLNA